ncbi:MAG: tetratricopeptide repeat protein [Candidatus Omnitrophica bacterium]|nr:tetratricopeptide repeat protein [Candidatus Omnitrophota bacterium]
MREWRMLLVVAWVIGTGTTAEAQGGFPTEEQYLTIQQAFLQEAFRQVVALVQQFAGPDSRRGGGDPTELLQGSSGVPNSSRVWLWYVLSLERLQRSPEALRELDRLKAALANLAPERAAPATLQALWPEVFFWDGEISRKALKMVRARMAYQRLLAEYPQSAWKAQAALGLGLVLFHQQAYDAAAAQFHDVAQGTPASAVTQDALLLEGMCDVQLKRFEDAADCFRRLAESAVDQPTRHAQALFYLGEALTGLGRFEEAARTYQQAVEADPRSRWADLATFGASLPGEPDGA